MSVAGGRMSIVDFREMDANAVLETDICIIGTGPAGIGIAAQFVDSSTRVLLLESGGLARDARYEALNKSESIGARRTSHELVRTRGFGGTSALWTGRCGVFDEIDYQRRPWLAVSGWPISHATLEPFFDRAGILLGLGPALYSSRLSPLLRRASDAPGWDARRLLPVVWQFSRRDAGDVEPAAPADVPDVDGADAIAVLRHTGAPQSKHLGHGFLPVVQHSRTVDVLLHATATSIDTCAAGNHVNAITVKSLDGKVGRIEARRVVLACGGIDNARLLLASTAVQSCGVGNDRGMVGRFLTDHTFAGIGTYFGKGSEAFRTRLGNRWLDRNGARCVYQIGLRMAPELQRREGLLNCSVHLFERSEQQHPISMVGDVLRQARRGEAGSQELLKLLRAAGQPLDLAKGIHDRFVLRRPSLARPTEVVLGCVVEQELDPDSRIALSEERDALGVPLPRIDWRISDLECRTARRMSDAVFAEMERLGYALPARAEWLEHGADGLRERLRDLAHPMCATRMSDDPATGVVDANCKVHGVDNLYVAGSSVFGTPGHMNPTLMIVALSVRLADHLKSEIRKEAGMIAAPAASASPSGVSTGELRRARVGIVGAGDRVRRVYLPALAALADECEIAGIVSRSRASAERLAAETGSSAFATVADLMAGGKPDFLVSAVSSHAVDEMLSRLVDLGVPVLLETPFAWSLRHGRKMLKRIQDREQVVGVAEQTPFLPMEQFKRRLIDLGVFGRITAAENCFAAYDYHGIAAIRAYLDGNARPVRVNATRSRLPSPVETGSVHGDETWTLATVTFDDGTTLVHHYSDAYFDSALRGPRSLRLYGTSGSMDGAAVKAADPSGSVYEAAVQRQTDGDRLLSLSLQTPAETYTWDNPYKSHALSDEQIAVTTLLSNMGRAALSGGVPAYPAKSALEDMEILAAVRYSSEANGAPVPLPLRPIVRKLRRIPGLLGSKVFGRLKAGAGREI